MSDLCGLVHDRVKITGASVRRVRRHERSPPWTCQVSAPLSPNVSWARLALDVSTAVLDKALDSATQQSRELLDSLSVSEPPGLTFSPAGLSPGRVSRFVADL